MSAHLMRYIPGPCLPKTNMTSEGSEDVTDLCLKFENRICTQSRSWVPIVTAKLSLCSSYGDTQTNVRGKTPVANSTFQHDVFKSLNPKLKSHERFYPHQ